MSAAMTLEQAMQGIRTKPVVPLWPVVAVALDLSRGSTYAAAARGEIDVIGRRLKRQPPRRCDASSESRDRRVIF